MSLFSFLAPFCVPPLRLTCQRWPSIEYPRVRHTRGHSARTGQSFYVLLKGKLENQESGIPPQFLRVWFLSIQSDLRVSEDCPKSEYSLKMIREQPKSPEHPATNNRTDEDVNLHILQRLSEDCRITLKSPINIQTTEDHPNITQAKSFARTIFFVISLVRSKHLSPKYSSITKVSQRSPKNSLIVKFG